MMTPARGSPEGNHRRQKTTTPPVLSRVNSPITCSSQCSHDSETSRSYPCREPLHAVDHRTASHRLESVERMLGARKFGISNRCARYRLQRLHEVARIFDEEHRVS